MKKQLLSIMVIMILSIMSSTLLNAQTQPVISAEITNNQCYGEVEGSIDIEVTEGTQPYNYLWSTSSTDQNISGLAAGTYTVTVSDVNGFTATGAYVINQPAEINIKLSFIQNSSCGAGGKLEAIVQGGAGVLDYEWKNSSGVLLNSVPGFPAKINAMQCSTYVIRIMDENSCVTERSYMVPKVTLVKSSNCYLTANLSCSTDFGLAASYLWNGNSLLNTQQLSCISNGSYQVLIANSNADMITSCSKPVTLTALSFTSFTNVPANRLFVKVAGGCAPYTAAWTISGGITPTYFTYAPVINGKIKHLSGTHTYSVVVTDACGQSVQSSFSPRMSQIDLTDENELNTGLAIFPNPSTGIFTIGFDDLQSEKTDIIIYNVTGQIVFQTKTEVDENNEIQIDLSNQPKGIYCIRANVNGKILIDKVVVE